jgi:hypothetical protein
VTAVGRSVGQALDQLPDDLNEGLAMNMKLLCLGSAVALAASPVALGQDATFTWLGSSFEANDLTPDGRVIVGWGVAISANGRVIIGHNAFSMGWVIHIPRQADINDDGVTDFQDLLIMLAEWGPCDGACPADLDEDGTVGFQDLLIMLTNWG